MNFTFYITVNDFRVYRKRCKVGLVDCFITCTWLVGRLAGGWAGRWVGLLCWLVCITVCGANCLQVLSDCNET